MKRTKILIVDDHPLVRKGLALTLSAQADFEVCGDAATNAEAMAQAAEIRPDLILVDISLKNSHGIELVKQIKAKYPAIKMLVLSGFQESLYGERAMRAGASGYLNKQESPTKLIEAIRTVLKGDRYVSPELSRRLVEQALGKKSVEQEPTELLSDRELEIFRMIAQGLSSGEIADQLHLSRHTVDTHRENIKRKIGAKSAGELNRQAVQWMLENG